MGAQDITIKAVDGGEFAGYLATPSTGKAPGIVVIQEIFGVNEVMRNLADWMAGEGFVALCPDLFWRQEPGIQITDRTDAEWARAFELLQGFDVDKGVDDIASTIDALRDLDACDGKVGAVGFCLGGRLAFLTATRTSVDAAVGYYGVALGGHLNETVRAPLTLHVATADEFVPADEQAAVHATLDPNPRVTLHDYEGNDHAFARVGGQHYDQRAAELAHTRTLEFLRTNLG
ncbi:MAG: dienelactone hydrolase family protein [Rhodospirillales bacterium]|jgi:carboxymethylenebutenolidase|nr:dienelactone hydrolase family protein [Rhodospirillales bacterium]